VLVANATAVQVRTEIIVDATKLTTTALGMFVRQQHSPNLRYSWWEVRRSVEKAIDFYELSNVYYPLLNYTNKIPYHLRKRNNVCHV